jgi:hypothetical protein
MYTGNQYRKVSKSKRPPYLCNKVAYFLLRAYFNGRGISQSADGSQNVRIQESQ